LKFKLIYFQDFRLQTESDKLTTVRIRTRTGYLFQGEVCIHFGCCSLLRPLPELTDRRPE